MDAKTCCPNKGDPVHKQNIFIIFFRRKFGYTLVEPRLESAGSFGFGGILEWREFNECLDGNFEEDFDHLNCKKLIIGVTSLKHESYNLLKFTY